MDNGSHKLLESVIQRTLHAHGFSRSSSQASLVLTDLLSRYMTLLASTCAKYGQHAGRTGVTPQDALCALDDLGVDVQELEEYCGTEGAELRRYAIHSGRRVEELNEFKAQLAYGLRQDRDDAIPLHFAPLSDSLLVDEGDEDDEPGNDPLRKLDDVEALDVFTEELCWERMDVANGPRGRPSSPSLPLSPISNPSSPVRKRARTSSWEPPVYIPDFLPPFPSETIDLSSPEPVPLPQQPPPPQSSLTQSQPPLPLVDRPPSPLAGPLTATSTSDYLTRVPYSQSSLSTTAEWHLPLPPPSPPPQLYTKRLPTPQTQPALISAYHHILTHPPLPNASNANPPRHKVAMALLSQTQATPRWDSPGTLYSNMVPGAPRVAAIGPTFPLPIVTGKPPDLKPPKEEDRDRRLPPALPRPVFSTERLTPLVSQQPSRIPDLARFVLPSTVFSRTTKLHHPVVLMRGEKKLVYGPGVNAPWNANPSLPSAPLPPPPTSPTGNDTPTLPPNGLLSNGKSVAGDGTPKPVLQDARLYATWDYEAKSFRDPLPLGRRARMGSLNQAGTGTPGPGLGLVLGPGLARIKTESKGGG